MNIKSDNLKTLGSQGARLVTTLYARGQPIFRLKEVRAITGLSESSARSFVRKLVERGIATRLKPGLFILVPFELGEERHYLGNPLVIAREIMKPEKYYLSHATAMEAHGMVTQPPLVIHVTSPKLRPPLKIHGISFRFIYCQRRHFFGITDHWVTKQERVYVSDMERTIVDGLKQPEYCGGVTEVAKGLWMRRDTIDVKRLIRYTQRIGVGAVLRRIGFLLGIYKMASPKVLKKLQENLTETYVRLDPILPAEGKYLKRWRLQLNVSLEELQTVMET